MEQRQPKQEGQEEMTLWDKEDMAVRMVLEEGKLNMCLRVLQEYKALVRPAGAGRHLRALSAVIGANGALNRGDRQLLARLVHGDQGRAPSQKLLLDAQLDDLRLELPRVRLRTAHATANAARQGRMA